MIKFNALLFKFLPNEAHYRFFERATREIAAAGDDVQAALGPRIAELNDWFVKERACVEWYRKSALTALIADAKGRLDNALVGLSAQVNGGRYSTEAAASSAAERLHVMLKSYGKVINKPYLQETGAAEAIFGHLGGDLAADVATAGMTKWTAEIRTALDDFAELLERREAQTLGKPQQGFREVRRGIEGVWHAIVVRVNSGATLDLSPGYAALIRALNPEIEYLNGEFHRVRYDIAAAEPEPIPQQAYTGQPCTPVPDVRYTGPKGMVKLELGRDFNLVYKNNVDAGNAECTAYGKGAYRGHRTVTFIIA